MGHIGVVDVLFVNGAALVEVFVFTSYSYVAILNLVDSSILLIVYVVFGSRSA